MHAYPLFLDLTHATCLVIGTGSVGRRKIASLLQAHVGELRVVTLSVPDASVLELLGHPSIRLATRPFVPTDLDGCMLVCAASNNPVLNATVASMCQARAILCMVADNPELGSCISPALASSGDVRVGISTGGISPALAARIKKELEIWLADRYAKQLVLLRRARAMLLSEAGNMDNADHDDAPPPSQEERAKIFRQLASAEVGEALRQGKQSAVNSLLFKILPPRLHCHIVELLNELV